MFLRVIQSHANESACMHLRQTQQQSIPKQKKSNAVNDPVNLRMK